MIVVDPLTYGGSISLDQRRARPWVYTHERSPISLQLTIEIKHHMAGHGIYIALGTLKWAVKKVRVRAARCSATVKTSAHLPTPGLRAPFRTIPVFHQGQTNSDMQWYSHRVEHVAADYPENEHASRWLQQPLG